MFRSRVGGWVVLACAAGSLAGCGSDGSTGSAARRASGGLTPQEISLAESRAPAPSYWFGPTSGGTTLSKLTGAAGGGTVSFSYGHCGVTDGKRACQEAAETSSFARAGYLSQLPSQAACWQRHGQAWVLACGQPYRLLTGDRVVEFFVLRAGAVASLEPWRQSVAALQRFDRQGGPKFPATAPFTCDELVPVSSSQRQVIPKALVPAGCASS